MENALPLQTAPEIIQLSLQGFADKPSAERFGDLVAETVRSISRYINLERLDGITVAFDYDRALAGLDRGYKPSQPLTRTGTEQLVGVAMTPAVLRQGAVKAHMVFHAPFVMCLEECEDATPAFCQAFYLVAHECGHVEDLKHRDEAFPGTILQRPFSDAEEAVLHPIAEVLWEEYAASRASAIFGEELTTIYEKSFTTALSVAYEKGNSAIRSFRSHRDVRCVLQEAGNPVCEPLRTAAYLLGHLDGLDSDIDQLPETREQLEKSPYKTFIRRLERSLRELWRLRGHWASPAEFDLLKEIAREVLADGGMIIRWLPDGQLYVDIPFSPETI
jgi:hypothetical protein